MTATHISLAGTATVGPKGQVVIPADVREKMGIAPGDKLIARYGEDKQSIAFVTEAAAQELVNKMGNHIAALQTIVGKR